MLHGCFSSNNEKAVLYNDSVKEIEESDTSKIVENFEMKSVIETDKIEETDSNTGVSYKAKEYMKYPIESHYKKIEGDFCYELVIAKSDASTDNFRDVKVFISKQIEEGIYNLKQNIDIKYHDGAAWDSEGLFLYDINFDGVLDILVGNGHYGASGNQTYSAFIWNKGKYEACESFTSILNAAIDEENQVVLGWWKAHAAGHSHAKYSYVNGEYIVTEILTIGWGIEEGDSSSEDTYYIKEYILETFSKGEKISEKIFSVEEYSRNELEEIFCSEESEWAIYSKKWRSFSNR